jgi:Leucine-rich repeat (LRR) protein
MSNPIDFTFANQNLMNTIFMNVYLADYPPIEGVNTITDEKEDSHLLERRLVSYIPTSSDCSSNSVSTLSNCRLVSTLWKTYVDTFLGSMWKELQNNAVASGVIFTLSEIAEKEKSPVVMFKKLACVLKKQGGEIPNNPMPIRIGEFRMLQYKIAQAEALQTIWSRKYSVLAAYRISNIPPADASTEEIGKFLNNPANASALSQITLIDLSYLNLKVVPPELNQLSGLQQINLSNNQLREVPDFAFTNLRQLYLNYNQLRKIPNFTSLPKLEELNLSNNQLREVPNFTLANLLGLELSHNWLSEIPNFTSLPKLTHLYLSYNRLSEIPNFTSLQKLEIIEAYYNLLKELPDFANLPRLKRVSYTTTTN